MNQEPLNSELMPERIHVKVDGHRVFNSTAWIDPEGRVVALGIVAPSSEKAGGEFGPDKLAQSDNPVFMDAALKEGPCEVEMFIRGEHLLWKGKAMRKRGSVPYAPSARGSGGYVGKTLMAHVSLEDLTPPPFYKELVAEK